MTWTATISGGAIPTAAHTIRTSTHITPISSGVIPTSAYDTTAAA